MYVCTHQVAFSDSKGRWRLASIVEEERKTDPVASSLATVRWGGAWVNAGCGMCVCVCVWFSFWLCGLTHAHPTLPCRLEQEPVGL